ncbi:hypothetical protein HPB47_011975 [Ixodes persulcatus]|uniref:Uncharacterized protein n=1 Tax=Ixodes persulcatus TaxID=34615 RepID=A0AC60NV49_IXOPE|nr:hypothetical protein HPB47_011975 [Ixodes persulcatus]
MVQTRRPLLRTEDKTDKSQSSPFYGPGPVGPGPGNTACQSARIALQSHEGAATTHATEDNVDYQCGLGSCRPKILQRLANPRVFFVVYSVMGILQGAYKTYFVGTLSTIERRFAMSSKTTGIILIADNLSPIIINLIAGYYASRISRPKLMGIGALMVVLSCLLSIVPYLVYGPALHILSSNPAELLARKQPDNLLCSAAGKHHDCAPGSAADSYVPFALFFVANFINGFGGSTFFIVGSSYMDDNIQKKNSPMYFGMGFAFRLLGPVLGFLTAGICLRFYEDPFHDPGITPRDPRWVGAWWMGYILFAMGLALVALPMMLFPRILPSGKHYKVNNLQKLSKSKSKDGLKTENGPEKHPFINFAICKGGAKVVTTMVGIMVGAVAVHRLRPRPTILAGYSALVEIALTAGFIAMMFIGCDNPIVAGVSPGTNATTSLVAACNVNCDCTTQIYEPVCSSDKLTSFFSPCHAGCKDVSMSPSNQTVYSNCSCIATAVAEASSYVTPGLCGSTCNKLSLFLMIVIAGQLLGSTGRIGSMLIYLRCVDPIDKSMALGTTSSLLNMFAFIPYPLVYGAILDSSCLVWEEKCGRRGNCWLYDIEKLRFSLHLITVVFLAVASLCYVAVVFFSGRITNFYEDDLEEEKGEEDPHGSKSTITEAISMESFQKGDQGTRF